MSRQPTPGPSTYDYNCIKCGKVNRIELGTPTWCEECGHGVCNVEPVKTVNTSKTMKPQPEIDDDSIPF